MGINQTLEQSRATPKNSPEQSPFRKVKSRLAAFYHTYEKYTELAIFGVGFIWDSLTMTRVDNLIDEIILLFYLALIGVMIILTLRSQYGASLPKWIRKVELRFTWVMQFCFGGLASSFVIFYFKSASWSRTQFFFLLLICLWIGNEFLKHRLRNPVLLSALYCFCLFSFLAFFLPVVLAAVNAWIFLLAGSLSLLISLSVFAVGMKSEAREWRRRMRTIVPCIAGVVLAVNILYFANLIPPVPLALKSAGIYHQVIKTSDGYLVKYVHPSLLRFWRKWDDPFYLTPGEGVYCFTAIFAPGKVHIPIFHVWSRKTDNGWQQTDRIRFHIAGGREGGYRGFTKKSTIGPGEWRVEVVTERGQTLGRIAFTAIASPDPHPPLESRLIN